MGNQQRTQTVIHFGSFEADLHTQELRRRGTLLRLPSQSFQVLQMLLERRGALVTRDELRAVLWTSDTFVDFDHGLHAAVNRLREVLGDSADRPRLIETLPRRGYRFIGEIRQEPIAIAIPPSSTVSLANWRKRSIWLAVIGMAGVALLIPAVYRLRSRLPQTPRVSRYSRLTNDPLPKVVLNFPLLIQLFTNGPRIYFSQAAAGLDSVAN